MYFVAYFYNVLGRGLDKATKLVTEASLRVRGMRKSTGMQTSIPDENAALPGLMAIWQMLASTSSIKLRLYIKSPKYVHLIRKVPISVSPCQSSGPYKTYLSLSLLIWGLTASRTSRRVSREDAVTGWEVDRCRG